MGKLQLFLIIYMWAVIDALLINWFLLPHITPSLKKIFTEKYMKLSIAFIMISLVMPIVYWIEVPLTLKYCCTALVENAREQPAET